MVKLWNVVGRWKDNPIGIEWFIGLDGPRSGEQAENLRNDAGKTADLTSGRTHSHKHMRARTHKRCTHYRYGIAICKQSCIFKRKRKKTRPSKPMTRPLWMNVVYEWMNLSINDLSNQWVSEHVYAQNRRSTTSKNTKTCLATPRHANYHARKTAVSLDGKILMQMFHTTARPQVFQESTWRNTQLIDMHAYSLFQTSTPYQPRKLHNKVLYGLKLKKKNSVIRLCHSFFFVHFLY